MACVELPKDAEGREIPLDVEFLYSANGESVKPYSFTFRRYDGFGWEMHLVGASNSVYDPKSFYLTQPDSWERLEEDLDRAVENGDAGDESFFQSMACAYMNHGGEMCGDCKFWNKYVRNCTHQMLEDVVSRIRKLSGDD